MNDITVFFLLVLGGILLTPAAERLRVPAPVLTTVYGLLLAMLPFIPHVRISPDIILPLLLPPLLYAAARRSSWNQFLTNIKPILIMAVVLVFVTAAAVAALAATLYPSLPFATAVVLGAIVSPPDAAAVTTIASRLGLPRRLVTILEGEGLFNDVTALTLYQVAVGGLMTGSFSFLGSVGVFGYATIVAILVGALVAMAASWWMAHVEDVRLVTGVSLMLPYLSYVLVDQLHGSGVLAVLTTAFYLAARTPDPDDVEGRLTRASFWDVTELMVTAVTFGFVGLELVDVIGTLHEDTASLVWKALAIAVGVMLVRAIWMMGGMWVTRWRIRWTGQPMSWRVSLVLSWSGMRGVVTIVTAIALPAATAAGTPIPGRDQILYISMSVVVVTLLLQGLTLPWLIRAVGLRVDASAQQRGWQEVVDIARHAAGQRLDELTAGGDVPSHLVERLHDWHAMLAAELATEPGDVPDPRRTEAAAVRRQVRYYEAEMMSAARAALLRARLRSGLDPGIIDEVLQRLDIRAAGR